MTGKNSGFTLIEMLIVVVIIGVISLSAVPVAELTFIKTKETELENNLERIRHAIKLFKRDARIALARQASYDTMISVPESQLYPPSMGAIASPSLWLAGGKHEIKDSLGNVVAEFYPKPYLDGIPLDPFVGGAVWLVHYASGTLTAEYSQGTVTDPADHVGIFDVSCITDPVRRRGFVQAIDGTKYQDW